MKGLEEFLELCGGITVLQIVETVMAIVFCVFIYRKVRDYLINKHEVDKERNAQLKEALDATRQYPKYREQSIKIQQLLEDEIQELRVMQKNTNQRLEDMHKDIVEMKQQNNKRDQNKLRDMLLQSWRYHTNIKNNPSQSWTEMEAEAFWALFRDYEEAGGDGFMHTDVEPDMKRLTVITMGTK